MPDADALERTGHRGAMVVAIGTSAGGLTALRAVLGGLPPDLPAPVVVVQHVDPRHQSLMADILGRHCALEVREAADGDPLEPGTVLVAPPDHHLVVTGDLQVALTHAAPVRFTRPPIDVLFESVADSCGPDAIAVVLTGTGQAGAAGAQAVDRAGGTVMVQDPATAEFPGMPRAVVAAVERSLVLPLEEVAGQVQRRFASREQR